MEAIVNYSSEDDQDEPNNQIVADRGGPSKRNRSIGSSNGGGNGTNYPPFKSGNGTAMGNDGRGSAGGRGTSNKHEEETQRYPTCSDPHRSSYYSRGNGRAERESREGKSQRDDREARSQREPKDLKSDRYRSKDFRDDYKKDNDNRDGRRQTSRDEERSHHYGNRHNFSSTAGTHHKDRYGGGNVREERSSRYNESSTASRHHQHQHHHHHQRARAEREDRSNRYERSDRYRSRHNRRSRDSRSRSPRSNSRERCAKQEYQAGFQPLEQARQSALEMERKLNISDGTQDAEIGKFNLSADEEVPGRRVKALLSLPLNDNAPKQPNVIAVAPLAGSSITGNAPNISSTHSSDPAVIQLPSYYNPSVINPNKYAEQVQKRKLLWGAKKNEDTTAKWGNAQFSQDTDGKVASKFMRLMGIKGGVGSAASKGNDAEVVVEQHAPSSVAPDMKSREAMFSSMEQQYEVARQATHTMRGVGLGFGSQARPF